MASSYEAVAVINMRDVMVARTRVVTEGEVVEMEKL